MNKASVLIVEDNFIVMMELKDRLVEMGYEIADTAASGLEAIKKAVLHHPDLTIMDIRLKGEMDGIEAAAKIKEEFDIPVIYLTAHTDNDTLQRAKITEPFGYIIKPFEERELHSTIEMALYKHKMEKKLKESEHWLSATLKSIGDALIATDSRGTIKLMNPVAEEITGWDQKDALGSDIVEVFKVKNENEAAFLENPVIVSLKNKSIVGETNKILVAKNGTETPVDFSSAPIRDEKTAGQAGLVDGVVLVFRDITERKKSEELIEKQRIFLREIIDTDPNFITVKDAEGKFELTNKAMAKALGSTTDEMSGKSDVEFFNPEEIEYQRRFEKEALTSHKEIFNPEEKLIDSRGKIHLLQTFRRAIRSRNRNEKLVLSVASDITELKLAEKALRESEDRIRQKAEELSQLNLKLNESEKELIKLNASKDKFFSIIAHDLRSPFTALLGLSEHLVDEIDILAKEELRNMAENILKSSRLTFGLMENLLQWARVKTGRINFIPKEINIKKVLDKMTELYQDIAEKKNISLVVDAGAGIFASGDANMIESILRNLISNSIKFTERKGQINIKAKVEDNIVAISVSDTGVGISPDKISRLFKIGYDISTQGTENEKGSGLGLILCKEFIEINKGKMTIESREGKGSTFSFTLPSCIYIQAKETSKN